MSVEHGLTSLTSARSRAGRLTPALIALVLCGPLSIQELAAQNLTEAHYRWRNDDGGEGSGSSPHQVSETSDDTTASASDVLVAGMSVTPGAGDYHVWFSGSVEGTDTNSTQFVSLYVNGAQLPHTEREIFTELSIPNTSFPVALHARVTGILAGQAIDVRWRTTVPTATIHERTLVVTPINPANSTEVSETLDDTTGSATDVLASGMSITPGAGDYHIWFSSSVEASTASSTQNVSLYVNGVQVPHTEREILTENSLNDTSFPVALHARITGVLAGQAIDVRWRTTVATATMHERTLLVSQIVPADSTEVSATVDDTTGSISDALVSGMSITPGAGDYLVWFSGSLEGSSAGSRQHVSLYVNGAQVPHTEREIFTELSIADTSFPIATHAFVPGVLAGQAIDVRWRTTAGTATMHERTLVVEKLSSSFGASFAAAEDTKLTALAKNTVKRVRFEVSNEGGVTSGPVAYELQVAETATCSAGTYATVPTAASGHWQVIDSTFLTDGEATFNISPGLTDEATTFVAGQLKDAGNTTGSITLDPDEHTEIEFSVQATTNATNGGDYCFRLYDATNNQVLNTYSVYAEVSLVGDDLTQIHYRWRNDDGGEVGANSPLQASETTNDTTASASDVLVSGMTITPGAGDYHVWFSGSVEATATNSTQFVSLYVNGAQLPHTERQVLTEGSILNTSFPVATHALVTGVLAGQAIEVRWRTTAPTATMHERTLVVTPINPADSTQASATADDTTVSTSDVVASGMSLTPGAGDYHVWFSGSVENTIPVPAQNEYQFVSIYLDGVQISHSERQITMEESIPDTSFPVATHARLTGVTAGQIIDVRWRTTGGTATMHERTLLVTQITPADTAEVNATADDTTGSASDVVAGGMTITPGAGDYLVWFSASVEGTSGDSRQHVSLYVNGAQLPHTEREILSEGSIDPTSFPVATHAYVPGVQAGQAIDERWRTTAPTATMHERTLVIEKLSGATGATFAAVEDTKLTGLAKNTIKRVRLEVSNEGGLTSGPVAYELQVAETATCSAGTYTTVPTDTSGHWQVTDSTFITDGEPTSNIFPGLTDEATTFVAGELRDAANTTGSITLNPDELTELEFSVQATTNATDGGDYCFRLYDATNNQVLDAYTVYAEVSLAGGAVSLDLADHALAQIGDKLTTTSPVTDMLFRFKLTRSGTVTVDNLRVNFTTGGGVVNGDVSAGELWVDNNNDGAIDGGDTLIQGAVSPSAGVLVFTTDFSPALAGTNYLVRATIGNLVGGDTTTFSVGVADVDELEVVTETGAISSVTHIQDSAGVIYYSVGTNAADLKSGSPTLTLSSGTATLTVAQPDTVGVGDEITYNGSNKAYISGRLGPTVYTVTTATAGIPAVVAGATVNSILRAFNNLKAATTGSADVNHLNTSDLVIGGFQLNWACYNDGPDPSIAVRIEEPWFTGASNFIRVFTPTDPTQVGTTQRHNGTAGTGYRIVPTTSTPPGGGFFNFLLVSNDTGYVRIEGIEIDGTNVTNAENIRGIMVNDAGAQDDVRISHNLIHDIANSTIDDTDESDVWGIFLDLTSNTKVSNNIVYNIFNNSTNGASNPDGIEVQNVATTFYAYNNTFYNIQNNGSTAPARGINDGASKLVVRNNYVGLVGGLGGGVCFNGPFAAENNNVSSDATAAGAGSQINKSAYASYFVSTTGGSENLHLLNDSFTFWGSFGADLDSDPNLPVTDDIDGGVRDATTPDIGADEFGAAGTSLTLANHDVGQIGDQFTTTPSVTGALFRFHLTRTGTVTVDNLRVNFTTGGGIANGDVSVGELWVDNNNDGAIDGGDTLIQGSVTPSGAVFTFTTDFSPALAGTNYLVRVTVDNLAAGDTTTFSLGTADVDEVEGGVSEFGSVTNAVHTQDAGGVIYYSVGTNAADLKSGTPTVTISSGWASFSVSQPLKVGVGDEITYNGASKAYISSRASSTVYSVITATGQTPPDIAGATVNSILRAFNTLTAATTGSADVNHLNTSDLVAGGFQLNWACYNDGPDPSNQVRIEEPWVTGPSNFIRIFTPTDTTQVGTSQRHNGIAGSGYRIAPTEAIPPLGSYNLVLVSNDTGYVRIEGIEIDGSNVTNAETVRGVMFDDTDSTMEDNRISHCLIHDLTNSTVDDTDASAVRGIRLDLTNNSKVSNNIVYNITNVSTNAGSNTRGILAATAGKTHYIYNNTVYNVQHTASTGSARGIYDNGGSTALVRNNYVGLVDSALGAEAAFGGTFAAENNNVSFDDTAAGAGSQINKSAYASYFVSTTGGSENLHLLNDSFTLWGSFGADLDSDPNLPVTDDIDGGVRDGSTPDIGADEFGAVSCSPTLNFRSIGIQATPLANTGTASVGLGATTVDFSGVSLPANVGLGDELVFAGEMLYVLWRVSSTQVTVQLPASMSHTNESYTIQRTFRGATAIQDWETGRQGDLVADNRREVGVAYNDGVFTAGVVINGSTTDSCHFMQLTAASGQRHAGTAGTGVVLDGGGAMSQTVKLDDDYTRFEWFEVRNYKGATGNVVNIRAQNVLVSQVIVHDFDDVAFPNIDGISIGSTAGAWSMTVRNSIVYDGGGDCIQGDDADDTVTVDNTTVYGCKRGIYDDAGSTVNVRNTIAMDNTTADFVVSVGTQSNNLSSDGSAPGPGSLTLRSAVNQFVNITPGDEVNWDLHLKVGADAIDVGTDLSAFFVGDIDDTVRPAGAGWDMGADELGAATAVELISFTALGEHGAVLLEWETGSEIQNLGFHLYRSTAPDGSFERITENVIPGLGSSPAGATYSYRDSGLTNGVTYFYQLEDIETTGKTEMHGPVSATPEAGAGGTETEAGNHESLITYGDPTANSFRVVKRGRRRVVLELMTEGFYAEPQEDGTVLLDIPDFEPVSEAGSPSIPVTRPWIEALAGRKVKITAVRAYSIERVTGLPVAGTEALDIVADRRGTVRAARRSRRASFRGKGLFPKEAARLVSVGFQGDVKKAQLELAPLRWDSATGHLLLARRLVVVVSFSGVEPEETTRDGIRGRRRRRERRAQTEGGPLARLVTTDQGLHEVRFEDVFSGRRHRTDTLRLSHRTDTLRLSLSRHAEPVAFHVVPDAGRFGPGSKLYFLSEGARANPYGHEAVYELDLSGEGLRMEITSASASGASASYYWSRQEHEENRYYQAGLIDINDAPDLWLWDAFISPVTKSFPFQITDLAPTTEPARLSVWLQGVSDFEADPDHHLRIYVNGSLVQETSWDGKRSRRVEAEIGPGVLTEGENSIEIESVRDTGALYSLVMLDRFAVEYPRLPRAEAGVAEGRFTESSTATLSGLGPESFLVDVTGGGGPRWLEGFETTGDGAVRFWADAGRSYLAVSAQAVHRPVVRRVKATGLRRQRKPVDYLVIGPARFLDTVEPLLTHRSEQGLRTKAVAIEDVYETFGFGEARPEAIRDFIEFAYHHWPEPALRYVLLVGDASYDYKNYLKTGVENHVPPLMVKTSYLWTVSDPTLGAVNGEDNLPDVAVGRLPAANTEELRVMVEKILAYESGKAGLGTRFVLVADNPDAAGDFVAHAEEIARGVLSGRDVQKLYLSELGPAATSSGIHEAFDGGASLLSYIGHGGIHLWAQENIFNIRQVGSLAPQAQQPLFFAMNCLNGYFHFPYFNSLAEELLKAEGKGVIAAFAPSGLSRDAPAHRYHKALLDEVFNKDHERLGDAVLAGQAAYAETGAFPELLSIYHLLGDPALKIR